MLFSQAVQDNRGSLHGLVRELQSLPHQSLRPLRVAPAVEPRDRVSLLDPVSRLYEDLDAGARVYLVRLLLPTGAQSQGRATDPQSMKLGYVPATRCRYFPDLVRDRQVLEDVGVAALRPDELPELLVGGSGGESVLDRALRIGDAFELQEPNRYVTGLA